MGINNQPAYQQAMNALYARLGQDLYTMSTQGWQRMVLGALQADDPADQKKTSLNLMLYVQEIDGGIFDIGDEVFESDDLEVCEAYSDLFDACEELHALCVRNGDAWTSLTFVLDTAGDYNVKFGYETMKLVRSDEIKAWKQQAFADLMQE